MSGEQFNPFGMASGIASGTEWGVGRMLDQNEWRTDELAALGHEASARVHQRGGRADLASTTSRSPASADGNHANRAWSAS